jgi:glycosyltransferase involved in cell wall biosynthesis
LNIGKTVINITVLLPVYNEEATIIPLLKSAQNETRITKTVSLEIIVIS